MSSIPRSQLCYILIPSKIWLGVFGRKTPNFVGTSANRNGVGGTGVPFMDGFYENVFDILLGEADTHKIG